MSVIGNVVLMYFILNAVGFVCELIRDWNEIIGTLKEGLEDHNSKHPVYINNRMRKYFYIGSLIIGAVISVASWAPYKVVYLFKNK